MPIILRHTVERGARPSAQLSGVLVGEVNANTGQVQGPAFESCTCLRLGRVIVRRAGPKDSERDVAAHDEEPFGKSIGSSVGGKDTALLPDGRSEFDHTGSKEARTAANSLRSALSKPSGSAESSYGLFGVPYGLSECSILER